jgi:gentisate 1,2-dioxygenase
MSYSSEPLLDTLGMAVIEDRGQEKFADLPPRPPYSAGIAATILRAAPAPPRERDEKAPLGPHPYALRRAGPARHAARHAHQVPERPRHRQRGVGPFAGDDPVRAGKTQSLHRHPGEAWLYVVEGQGHSFMGTAPDKGQHYAWKKGRPHHRRPFPLAPALQRRPVNQCRLVRIHMFDSILETMRALMDPMVLFEEAEDTLISTQELSQIEWPPDHRPQS